MNPFLPIELAVYVMFILLLFLQFRKKMEDRRFFVLFAGLAFGIILEIMDILMWQTYQYGHFFLAYIYNVPLAIGVAWGILLHTSMHLSDRLGKRFDIPLYARPFMDALMVVSIDIVLDVLAVKFGGWAWTTPSGAEWFGVPFENFIGWIYVVLIFSFVARKVMEDRYLQRKERSKREDIIPVLKAFAKKIATPFISYILLVLAFTVQTAFSFFVYFIITGTYLEIDALVEKLLTVDDSLMMLIKIFSFAAIIAVLFCVMGFYIARSGALKLRNFSFGALRVTNLWKDLELSSSFLFVMTVLIGLLIVLALTGQPAELAVLIPVQIFIIALNFSVYLLAFNVDD